MMSRTGSSAISSGVRRMLFVPILLLQGMALAITAYLLWIALHEGASPAGCAGDAIVNCDHVLASRWSRVAGLPAALPAVLLYFLMFVATCVARFSSPPVWRYRAWWLTIALAAGAAGAAGWFIALQVALLGSVCLFCLAVHACGLLLMVLVVGSTIHDRVFDGPQPTDARPAYRLGPSHAIMLGLAGAGVLIAVQIVLRPRQYVVSGAEDLPTVAASRELEPSVTDATARRASATDVRESPAMTGSAPIDSAVRDEAPRTDDSASSSTASVPTPPETDRDSAAETRMVSFLDGKLKLRPSEHVLLGRPSAEWFIVELFDYTCSKCRQMHAHLEAARERYGDRLAVVLIPVPLNSGCNPTVHKTQPIHEYACLYARLALAVWKNNPDAFPEFHQWMFEPVHPPPPGIARSRAGSLLEGRGLFQESNSAWVQQRLDACIEVFRQLGAASVPKLVVGQRMISGSTRDRDEFFELLETYLKPSPADQESRSRKRQPVR